jgi:hypothetical protein
VIPCRVQCIPRNMPAFISRHVYPPLLNIVVRRLCVCWRLEAISQLMAWFYAGSCIRTSENSPSRTFVNKGMKKGRGC